MAENYKFNEHFLDIESFKKGFNELNSLMNGSMSDLKEYVNLLQQFQKVEKQRQKEVQKSATALQNSTVQNESSLKANSAALKDAAAKMRLYAKESEESAKKQKANTDTQKIATGSIKEMQAQISKLKEEHSSLNLETERGRKDASVYAQKISQLNEKVKGFRDAMRSTNSEMKVQAGSYVDLTQQNKKLNSEIKKLNPNLATNAKRIQDVSNKIKENTDKLKAFDDGMGRNFRNVGNYSSALNGLDGSFSKLGINTGLLAGGVAGVASVAVEMLIQGAIDLAAELKEVNKDLILTQNILGVTGGKATEATSKIRALSKVTGEDFKDILLATNAVVKRFGTEQSEVIDTISKSLIVGANANDEYLDSLKEYTTILADTNITFKEYNNILVLSSRAGGYSDKTIDSVKELSETFATLNDKQKKSLVSMGAVGKQIIELAKTGKTSDAISLLSQELLKMRNSGQSITAITKELGASPLLDGGGAALETLAAFKDFNIELTESQKRTLAYNNATQKTQEGLVQLTQKLSGAGSTIGTVSEEFKAFGLEVLNRLVDNTIEFIEEIKLLGKEFEPIINYFSELIGSSESLSGIWDTLFDNASMSGGISILKTFLQVSVATFHAIGAAIDVAKGSIGDFASGLSALTDFDLDKAKSYFNSSFEDIGNAAVAAFNSKMNDLQFVTPTIVESEETKKKTKKAATSIAQNLVTASNKALQEMSKKFDSDLGIELDIQLVTDIDIDGIKKDVSAIGKEYLNLDKIKEESFGSEFEELSNSLVLLNTLEKRYSLRQRESALITEEKARLIDGLDIEIEKEKEKLELLKLSNAERILIEESQFRLNKLVADQKEAQLNINGIKAVESGITNLFLSLENKRIDAMTDVKKQERARYLLQLKQLALEIAFAKIRQRLGDQNAGAEIESNKNSFITAAIGGLASAFGGFKDGGYTGLGHNFRDSTGDRVAGFVHENEYVVPTNILNNKVASNMVERLDRFRTTKNEAYLLDMPKSNSINPNFITQQTIIKNTFTKENAQMIATELSKVLPKNDIQETVNGIIVKQKVGNTEREYLVNAKKSKIPKF